MLYEIIRDRPDVHKGWIEAELDAQLFVADLKPFFELRKHVERLADPRLADREQAVVLAPRAPIDRPHGKRAAAIGRQPLRVRCGRGRSGARLVRRAPWLSRQEAQTRLVIGTSREPTGQDHTQLPCKPGWEPGTKSILLSRRHAKAWRDSTRNSVTTCKH